MSREKEIRDWAEKRFEIEKEFTNRTWKVNAIAYLLTTIDALRAENAAMREAIAPIINSTKGLFDSRMGETPDNIIVKVPILVGDLRKLAEAGKVK